MIKKQMIKKQMIKKRMIEKRMIEKQMIEKQMIKMQMIKKRMIKIKKNDYFFRELFSSYLATYIGVSTSGGSNQPGVAWCFLWWQSAKRSSKTG